MPTVVDALDALLPQTQCTKCGFPSCRAYAEALAAGAAPINRCPPGGDAVIRRLAAALGREYAPLDPRCGVERGRHVAVIDEPRCIGCTLCIQACPVDAIVGAPRQMHTVVIELCTGCDLCLPPCPVDCIAMIPATGADAIWDELRMAAARQRFEARSRRLARLRSRRTERPGARAGAAPQEAGRPSGPNPDKQAVIRAAVARVRARRAGARRRP
ncbi:MAG: RnfABCDGE type electron transport complex subunit B [Burkholderiales bacterium]|nr:RnfABCDGE type electron transport complex subunit B [Burkholderiales bacterium]